MKDVQDPSEILADQHFKKVIKDSTSIYYSQINKHKPWQRNLKRTPYSKRKLLDMK